MAACTTSDYTTYDMSVFDSDGNVIGFMIDGVFCDAEEQKRIEEITRSANGRIYVGPNYEYSTTAPSPSAPPADVVSHDDDETHDDETHVGIYTSTGSANGSMIYVGPNGGYYYIKNNKKRYVNPAKVELLSE